jgi:hypothetical protein
VFASKLQQGSRRTFHAQLVRGAQYPPYLGSELV